MTFGNGCHVGLTETLISNNNISDEDMDEITERCGDDSDDDEDRDDDDDASDEHADVDNSDDGSVASLLAPAALVRQPL